MSTWSAPRVVVAPTVEPVTLAEVRTHLRIDPSDTSEDALISAQISAARDWAEQYTGRTLAAATLEVASDAFPADGSWIELPGGPVRSVTSVTYDNSAGSAITLSGWVFDVTGTAPRIVTAYAGTWPAARLYPGSVRVRYVAGYGDASNPLPPAIRAALLLLVGDLYAHREDTAPGNVSALPRGADALLAPYRINWGI